MLSQTSSKGVYLEPFGKWAGNVAVFEIDIKFLIMVSSGRVSSIVQKEGSLGIGHGQYHGEYCSVFFNFGKVHFTVYLWINHAKGILDCFRFLSFGLWHGWCYRYEDGIRNGSEILMIWTVMISVDEIVTMESMGYIVIGGYRSVVGCWTK